ncbi:MAG: very short patch repair endonuclease [Chloroflexi bacterium]|nr:very short patch repair endonuclease [Chloroflexota bacterium]
MVDIVNQETRSRMMAGIRGRDTRPEMTLRKALHARGLRYRLHAAHLPGRPDLVFAKYRAVIFVHGCFWHRHKDCRYSTTPATRPDFWARKFAANVRRDMNVQDQLASIGWRVAIVWECALRKPGLTLSATDSVISWLQSADPLLELGAASN